MDQLLTKEESYEARRQLFKNIWNTAMEVGEKDDLLNKPKIVKTLRLNDLDRSAIGQKKKQKIRNLRAVCNKILDFCDCQEDEDIFYEQLVNSEMTPLKIPCAIWRQKRRIIRKKRKSRSLNKQSNRTPDSNATTSDAKDKFDTQFISKGSQPGFKNIPINSTAIDPTCILEPIKSSSKAAIKRIANKERILRKKKSLIRKSAQKYHRYELNINM